MPSGSALTAALVVALACGCPAPPSPDAGLPDAGADGLCPLDAMLYPGESACRKGPWSACAAGFVPDDGGAGCVDVTPELPCAGATREALGSKTCVPLGDCATPAPTGTSVWVDPTFGASQLDAAHVRTITEGLAAAPPGGVVFVAAGTYAESLTISRPVRLVGRCAEQVHVVGPMQVGVFGIRVAARDVSLEGLTVTGGYVGVSVGANASVRVEGCALEENGGAGYAQSDADSQGVVTNTVIRGTKPLGQGPGWGVNVQAGSSLVIADSALVANLAVGLRASGLGTSVLATDLVVRDTGYSPSIQGGRGLQAIRGARLSVTRGAIAHNMGVAVVAAFDAGVELDTVVVRDTASDPAGDFGRGVNVADGSRLVVRASSLLRNRDATVMVVGDGAQADISGSAIASTALWEGSTGRGITVQEGGALTLTDSLVADSSEIGVVVMNVGSRATLSRSAVVGTRTAEDGSFGHGVYAGSGVDVRLVACHLASHAAIGLALGPGRIVVEDTMLASNPVALFIDTAVALNVVDAPPAELADAGVWLTNTSRFLGNQARVGLGVLPLPVPKSR